MCFPNISNGNTLCLSLSVSFGKTYCLSQRPIRNTLSFSTGKTHSEKPKEKPFEVLSELRARKPGSTMRRVAVVGWIQAGEVWGRWSGCVANSTLVLVFTPSPHRCRHRRPRPRPTSLSLRAIFTFVVTFGPSPKELRRHYPQPPSSPPSPTPPLSPRAMATPSSSSPSPRRMGGMGFEHTERRSCR